MSKPYGLLGLGLARQLRDKFIGGTFYRKNMAHSVTSASRKTIERSLKPPRLLQKTVLHSLVITPKAGAAGANRPLSSAQLTQLMEEAKELGKSFGKAREDVECALNGEVWPRFVESELFGSMVAQVGDRVECIP